MFQMEEEHEPENQMDSQDEPMLLNKTLQEPLMNQNIESGINATDVNSNIESIKEVIKAQCRDMDQLCKVCEDVNIQLSKLSYSKQDGSQKNQEIIDLCNTIQKVQIEINDLIEKAVTIYEKNVQYDQNLLKQAHEQFKELCRIDSERKAIYNADTEEVTNKGIVMLQTLDKELNDKENYLKMVSKSLTFLRAQIINQNDVEMGLVSEEISKVENYKSQLANHLISVEEELEKVREIRNNLEIEHSTEISNMRSCLDGICLQISNEKDCITSFSEQINHLKMTLEEFSNRSNDLKAKLCREEAAIEGVRMEVDAWKMQDRKVDSELQENREYLSLNHEVVLKQLEESKSAVLQNGEIFKKYQNEIESMTNEKLILAESAKILESNMNTLETNLKSILFDCNKYQQNIDMLRFQLSEIESSNENEKLLSTKWDHLLNELDRKKAVNIELNTTVEFLQKEYLSLAEEEKSIMKQNSEVAETLQTENTRVVTSETYLKKREWESYMQAVNMDTMYGRVLEDIETTANKVKIIRDILGKVCSHQIELASFREKCEIDRKALIESLSKKIENKLLEIRTTQKNIDSEMEKIDEELCQLKQDRFYIGCEVEALLSLNSSNEKNIEQFKCEQLLLETHFDWVKSLKPESKHLNVNSSPKFETMDDIFGSSDAEEDEFKASNFDDESVNTELPEFMLPSPPKDQSDTSDSSVMRNKAYRNIATTFPIPIEVNRPERKRKTKAKKFYSILDMVSDSN